MSRSKAHKHPEVATIHLNRLANKAITEYRDRLVEEAKRTGNVSALVLFGQQCIQLGAMSLSRVLGPADVAEAVYRVADDFVARSIEEAGQ